ncbi:efflux RND transporter periplasmic adaptor subunit [Microbacterium sp. SA39]|uniref:efflux RND transporter periplasmic adaptor subunit n=1 Tax=Microbacterium sp. SA39 TaxID=1263625 RepID=UPI00061F3B2B|nr:efflux RND transporter periplasmic adaptor subunit [Microbacterium sp. SA39]KJQ54238.1 putative peptidoglycan binding domain protein [Microbacterium sp. SA39]
MKPSFRILRKKDADADDPDTVLGPTDDIVDEDQGISSGRGRRGWVIAATALVLVVAVAATILLTRPPADASEEQKKPPTETATVSVGDLTEQVRATGKLEFRNLRDLGSPLAGTVTGVPAPGTVVGRGQELFRVDDTPVLLMLGELPVWREFAEGMADGEDIRQLETNLQALGFFDRAPDDEFRWSTIVAIRKWQKSLGLEESGRIELGRIVFSPADVRVHDAVANVGSPAGGVVLKVSDGTKEAAVDIDPDLAANAPVGAKVDVRLPDGTVAVGTVTAVGAPVERDTDNGGKTLKLPLTIVLDDPAVAAAFDTVSVSVTLVNVIAESVLLVPVTALLAQPGGESAVERVVDGKTEIVTVELGKFADGMVEIVGGDLAEGDTVAVAK